jgi:hypothetical protein
MTLFCSNCGHSLANNERFCPECGHDVSAKTAGAPIPTPGPQPAPVQQLAGVPAQYSGPTPIPVAIPMPQAAPKRFGTLGTVLVTAVIVVVGLYYYGNSHPSSTPATPPSTPAAPPPAAGGGNNAALVQQQAFEAHWENTNGMLMLTTAKWTNNSTVNMTSAVVQCEQDNDGGTDLSQYRVTLNGPTNGNAYSTYSNIQIGAVATGMSKVNCTIVHVKPGS